MIKKVLLLLCICLPILASAQTNAFFALDTGTRDARHTTAEQQVTLLKELGFDGIAPSLKANGQKGIADLLRALDKQGLKMFAIYMGVNLDAETPISEDVKAVIRQVQGRDTVIWLTVMAGGCRPSNPKRDDEAVRVVTEVAELAEKEGLRVSLYPHAGFWLERVEDGVRLAQKVNRKNVGVTFNLCHWMKADGKELEERLEMAKPYLSVVTVNGLDADAKDWPQLVQPLDSGSFDVSRVLRKLKQMGYEGPVGVQHYNVRGPVETNLKRSMDGWKRLQEKVGGTAGDKRIKFEKIVIDAEHRCEAAAVMDVDGSGKVGIMCGEAWFEPVDPELRKWRRHEIRKIEYKEGYYDDFANLVLDVNGDGYPDVVSGGWFSKSLIWYENPGKAGGRWKEHLIDSPGNIETLRLWDVAGEGRPAVVPLAPGRSILWYELKVDAAGKGTGEFIKHAACEKGFLSAGIGFGDVNGDGRGDFITRNGWLEAPTDRRSGKWVEHREFTLAGHHSIPMPVCDINGDGLADIVYGMGHDYGLFWLEQKRTADDQRQWERHAIDRSWSQAHVVEMADLDGDGRSELITGKRYRAHNDGDPGGKEPGCLYYYTFDERGVFARHVVEEGGKVGTGIDLLINDINRDGKPDLVCPGKGGLYLYLNCGTVPETPEAKAAGREAELLKLLQGASEPSQKQAACLELARVGTAESVMALAPLLADKQLSHSARYALEAIPGGASEAALRDALYAVKGDLLAGVLSSLEKRGEEWAVPDLLPLLREKDFVVVQAAALSLGRSGKPQAVKAMRDLLSTVKVGAEAGLSGSGGNGRLREALLDGLLAAAEKLRAQGGGQEAVTLYDDLRALEAGPQHTVAAWRGALLSRSASLRLPLLGEALGGADNSAFQAALRVSDEVPGEAVTRVLSEAIGKVSPGRQLALCSALGRRKDAAALPEVLGLVGGAAEKSVRLAAIGAAGQIGHKEAVTPLLKLLKEEDADLVGATLGALAGLPEAEVNRHVLESLERTETLASRRALLTLAGERKIMEARAAVIAAMTDADQEIRKAALLSFGELADPADIPRVLSMLNEKRSASESAALERVLLGVCMVAEEREELARKLGAALVDAGPEVKPALLRALGAVGNAAALERLRAAMALPDREIRLEAVRVVCKWKTPEAVPLLLEVAKTAEEPTVRLLALRGYLGMAANKDLPAPLRTEICVQAAPLVERKEEKWLLLGGMTASGDPQLIGMLLPFIEEQGIRKEAAKTLSSLVGHATKQQVAVARRVAERLRELSVGDIPAQQAAEALLVKIGEIK